MKVIFKNVGQGDSIVVEWTENAESHIGIIDCNIYEDKNPVLKEVIDRKVKQIDFIILSHLHYDHYSGFGELLEYCIAEKIKIKQFLHTFSTEYFRLFSSIISTQKQQLVTQKFLSAFSNATKSNLLEEIDTISHSLAPLNVGLNRLKFLSPNGKDYLDFSEKQAKYIAKVIKSAPDFNSLSTIIQISNEESCALLTSDATKKAFRRVTTKVEGAVKFIQVPHHGSIYNLHQDFWKGLKKIDECPAVFSIGDVKKDKLPDKEVVEYFEHSNYHNVATNYVHGIEEFYGALASQSQKAASVSKTLSYFSIKKNSTPTALSVSARFSGDKSYLI